MYNKPVLSILVISLQFAWHMNGQIPPTLLKSELPPDISESYRANPHFYEIMSGFPHPNSYYMHSFDEVQKNARHDPEAMVLLGDHYRMGRSVPMDPKKALREYQRAASKGYAKADHRIAYMYADGLGLPKDPAMILSYLKKSADRGYDLAQYDYALVYLNGKFNEPRDLAKAYPYLLQASGQGHRNATELLAMLSFHAGSPNAGIPTGLSIALGYFRQAKDTDGERSLLQNINSYSGLRYYLRIIPDFIPGVTPVSDPTDERQGIQLIEQLSKNKHLTGEENFNRYRYEIAENILYCQYHKAQGNRESLLRFMLFCSDKAAWLESGSIRYSDAAGRDFRLTITYRNEEELQKYLDEFTVYPQIFTNIEMRTAADRVFVSLFLKENNDAFKPVIAEFFKSNERLCANLSKKYIAIFEGYEFETHRDLIIAQPDLALLYLEQIFERIRKYIPAEADTLSKGILPMIRCLCLHPLPCNRFYTLLASSPLITPETIRLLEGLKRASRLMDEDINQYFDILANNPEEILSIACDPKSLRENVKHVHQFMTDQGEKQLLSLCSLLQANPTDLITHLAAVNKERTYELNLLSVQNKVQNLLFEAWSALVSINRINLFDPNGVALIPEMKEGYVRHTSPCPDAHVRTYYLIKHDPASFRTWKCETINHYHTAIKVRMMLIPCSWLQADIFDPWQEPDETYLLSEWILLPPGVKTTFSFTIEPNSISSAWIPVIQIRETNFRIPYAESSDQ